VQIVVLIHRYAGHWVSPVDRSWLFLQIFEEGARDQDQQGYGEGVDQNGASRNAVGDFSQPSCIPLWTSSGSHLDGIELRERQPLITDVDGFSNP
jgi:hypothetical protein